ncbi:hypothetical protein O181_091759 [Austropuccinia psidii MF-1]|uniref:Uncharacterized protein n=1 Tax=Austropuccinia psidii MF-1 TaxID=1389203 RepID=A0A9Q3IXZ6_9BASI|nr:hypothetical protein [Austropuccinia psidii MF-1]
MESTFFQLQGQKDEELAEEPKSLIHRPEERAEKDPILGERIPSDIKQFQTISISVQRQAQRTSEEAGRLQEKSRQGKIQSQLAHTLPTRVHDPQIGAFRCGQCIQYGQSSYGIHSQGAGKEE